MSAKTKGSAQSRGAHRRPRKAKRLEGNRFAALVEVVRPEVEARLEGLFDARIQAASPTGSDVVDLVAGLRDLSLRGGKRLRAALVAAGYRAADARASLEPALDAGVAVELLQAYFLIHDDWMDGDPTRRGGPAVHAFFAKRYGSEHLGAAAGILAGDLGVALATDALSRVGVPPRRVPRLMATFAQMQIDALAGQQRDIVGRGGDPEQTYSLKTSSYTVRGPLVLGAQIAGASPSVIGALQRFAEPAGVAFQLRDDLISLYEDPAKTGKPFANDIRQGKRTPLMLTGIARARGRDRQTLERVWGNPKATKRQLERAVTILESSGALDAVESRIGELTQRALDALDAPRLTKPGRELLRGAASILTDRRS